jgi:hypothetical protein
MRAIYLASRLSHEPWIQRYASKCHFGSLSARLSFGSFVRNVAHSGVEMYQRQIVHAVSKDRNVSNFVKGIICTDGAIIVAVSCSNCPISFISYSNSRVDFCNLIVEGMKNRVELVDIRS